MRPRVYVLATALAALALVLAGCGSGGTDVASPTSAGNTVETGSILVAPEEAIEIAARPDVTVLDVRTPEEYAEGHLAGATLVDFYSADFRAQIDALDRDQTYVVYCRSGNRSGQATGLMEELGFRDVYDVDGGIVAWQTAGLPVATE